MDTTLPTSGDAAGSRNVTTYTVINSALRSLPLLAVLSLCLPLAAQAEGIDAAQSSTYYEQALVRFHDRDFTAAAIQLKNAIQANPDNLAAHILLGRTYLELGDAPASEKELSLARQGGADAKLVLVPLARAYFQQGKYQRVFDHIPVAGIPPEVGARIFTLRGDAYAALRRWKEAEAAYIEASALDPDAMEPWLGRSNVLLNAGDRARAEDVLDQATAVAADSAEAWYRKGELRRLDDDVQGAIRYYDKAIELEADHLEARVSRAALFIDGNKIEAARADIDHARSLDADHPQVGYLYALLLMRGDQDQAARAALNRAGARLEGLDIANHAPSLLQSGVINLSQGNYQLARQHLSRLLQLDPSHLEVRKLLGELLVDQQNGAQAIEVLTPALAVSPHEPRVLALLGSAYLQNHQYAQASAMLDKAVALAPEDAHVRRRLAMSHVANGQYPQAIRELDKAVALDASEGQAWLMLGILHLEGEDYRAAMAVADALAKQDARNPFSHHLRAMAHQLQGDLDAARAGFERALQVDPDYAPAQLNLARLELQQGRVARAELRYQTLFDADTRDTAAMQGLADVAAADGRIAAAIDWLEKVLAITPDWLEVELRLTDLYLRTGQSDKALRLANNVAGRVPDNLAVLLTRARAERAAGKHDHMRLTYRRMSRISTLSAQQLLQIAQLQVQTEDLTGARLALQKAVQADANDVSAQAALANLEMLAGNLDRALAMGERLRGKYPQGSVGDILTGDALLRRQSFAAAVAAYDAGQQKAPSTVLVLRLYDALRGKGDG